MASEPSWGPCIGNRPLKWTEIGPTNNPWMISDEFETFGDNHFWRRQTKTQNVCSKIIHFIKIQNIHLKQIFILLKSRIFIRKNHSFFLNPEYSLKEIFIFSKEAVSARAKHRSKKSSSRSCYSTYDILPYHPLQPLFWHLGQFRFGGGGGCHN